MWYNNLASKSNNVAPMLHPYKSRQYWSCQTHPCNISATSATYIAGLGDKMKSIKELMKRYDISRQGIMSFVDRHLEEINADGEEHAKQTIDGWQFDDTAIRIIDKLRGLSEVTIVEREESEQVQELKEEVDNLKSLLLMTQNKLVQKQEELTESQKQLMTAERKYLMSESSAKDYQSDLKVEELKRQHLEEKLSATESQLSELQSQFKNLQGEVERLKKRGLVSRIFNNL